MRPFLGQGSPYSEAVAADVEDPILAAVPAEVRRTMRAAGLAPMVAQALRGAARGQHGSLEMLAVRQNLGMRLISLETQLAAVIFEADCTGELIEAISFDLEDRSDLRELRLALGSLVVGALAATVAGTWDLANSDSRGPAVLGLMGGLGSSLLGGAAFIKRPYDIRFMHEHNLLSPIVTGRDEAEMFPRFVFLLLTLPAPDGGPSPRERLLKSWGTMIEERVGRARRSGVEALLYGAGGTYEQELMALRERLYDSLELELNAQARDLELLDRFLVRALEEDRPAPP